MLWKTLLLCLPLLLLGGRTIHPKERWIHWLKPIDAGGFDVIAPEETHIPPCIGRPGHKEVVVSGTSARHACYGQPGHAIQLTHFGIVVTEVLDANDPEFEEDCEIVLETSDDGTTLAGSDIASSAIQVGKGNVNSGGVCGDDTLDTVGEFCMRELDQTDAATLVDDGGWYTIHVNLGTSTGKSCLALRGVQAVVWGYVP